jgi:hypothetical protein
MKGVGIVPQFFQPLCGTGNLHTYTLVALNAASRLMLRKLEWR